MEFDKKDYDYTGYNSKHLEGARILRRKMTPQEKKLWYSFLRDYPVKIYRQRPIDRFIVDFYCSKANLVIEIDGGQHYTLEGKEYDIIRTDVLEKYNLKLIRFSYSQIEQNLKGVCEEIDQTIKDRICLER